MPKVIRAVLGIMTLASTIFRGWAAEPTWEYAVQVSATVGSSPARVTLSWPQDTISIPASYTVQRKALGETAWGPATTLSGTTTSFTDSSVSVGGVYEYQITKAGSSYTGYGYVSAAIQAPLIEDRGTVLLVVDNTHSTALANELSRLEQDLVGDGWKVVRRDFARTDSVANVKAWIQSQYNADPARVNTVFLFGRIPVPYSGLQNPDGHSDHYGAWPADVFYGDMDGVWTDSSANYSQTQNTDARDRARLSNFPGDGKFDQTTLPSAVELKVGRVDLSSMPGRASWGGPATLPSETELLRQYLQKDHDFRHTMVAPKRRAIVGDYFGTRNGEAFAASGYRNFAPLFGASNIVNVNLLNGGVAGQWMPNMAANDYLWAYGCGAGSYMTIGGLGNSGQYNDVTTLDIIRNDSRGTFNFLFGSWLGDWDSEDNILRSPLAAPTFGLTAAWSGRPHWFAHHMAIGETIGHAARLTQNNGANGPYRTQRNSTAGGIHVALMGDPTLRLHPVAPPEYLGGSGNSTTINLTWTPSRMAVSGYHVYRAANVTGPFTRLTATPVTGNNFTDWARPAGAVTYMVRAVKLETSASGTYTNSSQGLFWTPGSSTEIVNNPGTSTNTTGTATNPPVSAGNAVVWFDDSLPAGANMGGSTWTWSGSNPAPFSGTAAHQSTLAPGLHEYFFNFASGTLSVGSGESLFTYVYLDPANPPTQIMLSWNANNWDHRAYWGANKINYGADGTAGRRYMGPLPTPGQWVRLEIPANQVDLEGRTLTGMGFSLFDGRATWDYAGKSSSSAPSTSTLVTIAATDSTATEGAADPAAFTITRTGSTGAALTVGVSIGGSASTGIDYPSVGSSVTLAAGVASTTVTISATPDALVEGPETVTLSLASGTGYTVGSPSTATASILETALAGGGNTGSGTNSPTGSILVPDYAVLAMAKPGDHSLHILSPTMLELRRITTKEPDPATLDTWNFVDDNGNFSGPNASQFAVTVNGQSVGVQAVGFRRRALYAPLAVRDLRIDNCFYLRLASPIANDQTVQVKDPSGALWPTNWEFIAKAEATRFSPAIHVNQEGYVPSFQKKAMVGYYLGSLGEMDIPFSGGFKLINTGTGAEVYQGQLSLRADIGYSTTPRPYQKVYEADFSSVTQAGEYQLFVPGLGLSYPFLIDDGVAMAFTRTYALGLYHQRCGTNNVLEHSRHTHDVCHLTPAEIPSPAASFPSTWSVIASESANYSNNPRHTAPQLKDEESQLYPFINQGTVDVSRGHHDAGDYSKYTINSANLIHYLIFTADTVPGAGTLDNLGLPESGDGIGDMWQLAKWEADFLAKMQDADGGFYFLVYPRNRRYENNVTPDKGDAQVVWPKTTAVTAASVGALAQCASSPQFRQRFPEAAALYLQKAQLGWQFLTNAIARFGKDGAYQKITPYGDDFMHDDELAWAACEMFLATGQAGYHQKLTEWFPNPSDSSTYRWGWWRMCQSYGNAIRSYAFAARTSRVSAGLLNAAYLSKCETEIRAAANDGVTWSQQNAYGTSFPYETKAIARAGWYFSSDYASDVAAAYQLDPRPEYLATIVANMNYEAGCNPVNVTYVTGLGWKRQREIVHQHAVNDRRVLPPSGIPLGNIQEGFYYMETYKGELNALCFPSDWSGNNRYPFYDRWADAYNVMTEFVHLNQARSLLTYTLLSSFTAAKSQAWKSGRANILVPTTVVDVDSPTTLTLETPGLDYTGARIVWEGRDQEPAFGPTFAFVPKNNGLQWVEVDVQWPDGRRVFATNSFYANSAIVDWVDDALPAGAVAYTAGGDTWNWINEPQPFHGSKGHLSAANSGLHLHYFDNATATLAVLAGDTLFAHIYIDPENVPQEIMLMWNDGDWEHRAYWGANNILYGYNGTESRRYMGAIPEAGQWIKLEVPAKQVGLEGSTLKGMAFALYGGKATWDYAGKASTALSPGPTNGLPTVTVTATDPAASRAGDTGTFLISRTGSTAQSLTVTLTLGGGAVNGTDYDSLPTVVTIPAGASSVILTLQPRPAVAPAGTEGSFAPASGSTVVSLSVTTNAGYTVGTPATATITIADSSTGAAPRISGVTREGSNLRLTWSSVAGSVYRVVYKDRLTDAQWTELGSNITATSTTSSMAVPMTPSVARRFFAIKKVN